MTISIPQSIYALLLIYASQGIYAETIYQWSDPWGQIQYSKTPVSGAMVSPLTALPVTQNVTEQQKQEAMLKKLQIMENASKQVRNNKSVAQLLMQQRLQQDNYCRKLRDMLADIRSINVQRYYYPGNRVYPDRYYYQGRSAVPYDNYPHVNYKFLEMDLYREMRKNCR